MVIRDMGQNWYRIAGCNKRYFQVNLILPAGIGNETEAVEIVTADSLKIHTSINVDVYESLDTKEAVENDTALWILISDGTRAVFPATKGKSFVKAVNKSATEITKMNITGV